MNSALPAAAVPAGSSVPESAQPATGSGPVALKDIRISSRSRFMVMVLRRLVRPWLGWVLRGPNARIAAAQVFVSSHPCTDSAGLPQDYGLIGSKQTAVPGHQVGDLTATDRPVVLWLHGGAFVLPADPGGHLRFLAYVCRDLGASGFLPDYRLAPLNKYPAALDDCERAYRALLEAGFSAQRIVIGGDSAGGNLVLGLLQRIRKAGLGMPSAAVCISPGTEMGRIHAPPSRSVKSRRDPVLPMAALHHVAELYAGGLDTADPELSPLYMDCHGLPPLFFLASDCEVLLDDTVLLARRAREADVAVRLEVWPVLPHAFPVMERFFPEAAIARADITGFFQSELDVAAGADADGG